MPPSSPQTPGYAVADLFSPEWLASEPLSAILNAAPVGVARLQSQRNATGEIVDFTYQLVNPMQQALVNHTQQDIAHQSLIELTPDVVKTGILTQLIDVVTTGWPSHQVEEYRLDGMLSRFDQLYVKSGDGVLMLVQDITYRPLSADEQQQQKAFLAALIHDEVSGDQVTDLRRMLIQLISGQQATLAYASWL